MNGVSSQGDDMQSQADEGLLWVPPGVEILMTREELVARIRVIDEERARLAKQLEAGQ